VPHEKGQGAASSFGNNLKLSWLSAVKLAVAICIAYFLAAWLGLAFQAEGVAVFWPAAGIAIGALLTLRPSTRLPVSVGVISATVAANFMFGRNIWLATAFGFVNAGEALLTAWLIGHWFGSAFKLDDVRQVLGFMVASAVGAAIGAIGGAAAVSLVGPTASPLNVWLVWFAADLLGIVTTAPLVIGLGEAVRVLPPRRELIEGGIGLTTLALLSVFVIFLPKGALGIGHTGCPCLSRPSLGCRALPAGVRSRCGAHCGACHHLVGSFQRRALWRRRDSVDEPHTGCANSRNGRGIVGFGSHRTIRREAPERSGA